MEILEIVKKNKFELVEKYYKQNVYKSYVFAYKSYV